MIVLSLVLLAVAQEAKETADKAIEGMREAASYHVKFTSKLTQKGGVTGSEGEAVRVKEGVLYLSLDGLGGKKLKAVRVAGNVFVYIAEAGWTDSSTDRDAARGWQNPDEVLEVLSKLTAGAKAGAGGTVTISLDAVALEKVLGTELKDSTGEATLTVDEKKRLSKLTVTGKDASGTTLDGEVAVVSYDTERSLTFKVDGKEIPLDKQLVAKIEKVAPAKK